MYAVHAINDLQEITINFNAHTRTQTDELTHVNIVTIGMSWCTTTFTILRAGDGIQLRQVQLGRGCITRCSTTAEYEYFKHMNYLFWLTLDEVTYIPYITHGATNTRTHTLLSR
ncbi:hypothetical protein CBL_12802 [Carabus blaptoides fortunei]